MNLYRFHHRLFSRCRRLIFGPRRYTFVLRTQQYNVNDFFKEFEQMKHNEDGAENTPSDEPT